MFFDCIIPYLLRFFKNVGDFYLQNLPFMHKNVHFIQKKKKKKYDMLKCRGNAVMPKKVPSRENKAARRKRVSNSRRPYGMMFGFFQKLSVRCREQ